MRLTFCLDENLPPLLVDPLERVHRKHRFRHVTTIGGGGMDDLELFDYVAECGADAIITLDRKQHVDDEERTALKRSGLRWLGLPTIHARGVQMLALQTSIVVPAVGHVIDRWGDPPAAYFLAGPSRPSDFIDTVTVL